MTIVEKKIWPKYFDLVQSGTKKFELRLADFDIEEGDTLLLREWNPETKEYTGRAIEKKVNYIKHFTLGEFNQKKEIEEKGLYIIQLE